MHACCDRAIEKSKFNLGERREFEIRQDIWISRWSIGFGKIGRGEIEGILEGKGARIIYGQITLAIDDRSIDEGEITSANGENHEDGKGKSFVERFFSY